jgi:hypothetical protein
LGVLVLVVFVFMFLLVFVFVLALVFVVVASVCMHTATHARTHTPHMHPSIHHTTQHNTTDCHLDGASQRGSHAARVYGHAAPRQEEAGNGWRKRHALVARQTGRQN